MNISVGTESIFVGTRPAGGPRSRLCDGIIMCLIAPKMEEIFKELKCQHWVPKFDTGCWECNLDFSLPFFCHFFCFLAHSWGSDVHYASSGHYSLQDSLLMRWMATMCCTHFSHQDNPSSWILLCKLGQFLCEG